MESSPTSKPEPNEGDSLEAEAEPYYVNGVTDSNVSDDSKDIDVEKLEPSDVPGGDMEDKVSNTQKDDDVPPEKDNNKQQLQPELLTDKSATTITIDKPEENVLTVIDGPLAKGKVDEGSLEGSSTVHNTPSPSVTSHTPNSSIGDSSLGELLGESAVLLENGSTSPESSNEKLLSMKSTEKPRSPKKESSSQPPGHVVSKSDEGLLTTSAASDVREKPPLKRVTSLPPNNNTNAAVQKVRSPHKPTHNRDYSNSSLDLVSSMTEDDDDDDENDIPPHIQSKIVEKSPAERYIRFKEKLGSGAYKDVYRAYDTIEGIEVAWNVVKLSGVPKAERVRIVNEVRLLERLHHPNIISFHGSWVNRETERVIFVTEILSSGTLKSFVQKVQLIRWKIFKRWAIQILKGLEYLHSQDPPIIHRDLKCDNIFINGTSGDLRIGDFGLSTAINKKNQPLSVLGTPEFMAPELYDENYNEKVDIYAFGMLLLEIITRDVPYHECNNPAQIYKKVTQGIPPASLRRVKSVEARTFIQTCLGIGEDASTRPSASDLLKHEFLTKKLDDEATIEVEPAVEDMVIEEAKNSMTFSDTGSERSGGSNGGGKKEKEQNSKYASSIDGHEIPSRGAERPGEGKPPTGKDNGAVLSKSNTKSMDSKDIKSKSSAENEQEGDDDDDDDHFGEMPENEANMKKVTVLMGRGTTLDDSTPPTKKVEDVSLSTTPPPAEIKTSTLPRSDSESIGSIPQYKVSAVPPIDQQEMGGAKPYPKEEINLALTIPDESQTTIEFDFDLVNDDPVQVAREMVMELDEVPDNAVLDISEAISGVARKARMKQNQWGKLQQHQQDMLQHQQQHSQSMMSMHSQQASVPQHQHSQSMMSMPSQGSISQGSVPMQQQQQGIQTPQGILMPPPPQHMYGSATGYPLPQGGYQNPGGSLVQPQLTTQGNESILSGQGVAVQAQPQHQQVVQAQPPIPPPPAPPQISTPQMQHPQQHNVQPVQQQQQPVSLPSSPAPIPQSAQQQQQLPQQTMTRSSSMEINPNISQPVDMITPRQLAPAAPPPVTTQAPLAQPMPQQESSSIPQKQQVQMPLHAQASMASADGSEADSEELRKLELEFEKKMQRAKKSYGTRMDNLHRSKEEAESQHQKILEKHEKERIEFEKRVKLAEEEQSRRLNQLEKEFMEKKKEARQQNHVAQPAAEVGAQPTQNGSSTSDIKPPLHGGHKRSSSNFDNSLQPHIPIPNAHHKRTSSDSDLRELVHVVDEKAAAPPPRPPIPRPPTTGGSSATRNRDRSSSISSDENK